jgi:hypothetical protein
MVICHHGSSHGGGRWRHHSRHQLTTLWLPGAMHLDLVTLIVDDYDDAIFEPARA